MIMELAIVVGLMFLAFFIYAGYRLLQVSREPIEIHTTLPDSSGLASISQFASFDLLRTGTTYNLVNVGWVWQDVWVGVYWKYDTYYEGQEGDFDKLRLYICLIPCYLIALDRIRHYKLIPRIDRRIDPICDHCHERQSSHPVPLSETESCTGKF